MSQFTNLRHLFNPVYSSADAPTQKLKDGLITPVAGCPARAADINITYINDVNSIGMNVIDDSKYSMLTLSQENGQYYDLATTNNIRNYSKYKIIN